MNLTLSFIIHRELLPDFIVQYDLWLAKERPCHSHSLLLIESEQFSIDTTLDVEARAQLLVALFSITSFVDEVIVFFLFSVIFLLYLSL